MHFCNIVLVLQGLLLEAKVYSYHNDKLSACHQAGIQGDEQNLRVSSQQGQDVRALQEQLTRLTSVVDSLQAENSDLRAKLSILDTCVCYPQCLVNGVIHNDGDTWQSDVCTQCVCQVTPCSSSPCQNQGYCVDVSPDPVGYQCNCLPPYDGPLCEVRQNPCVWPVEPGLCNFTVLRYYYDRFDEECRAFNYTGCGGNVNNYETIEACEEVAMRGACCFRKFRTDVDSLVSSDQMEESKCQVMSMRECKAMHRQEVDSYVREVVGYYPSLTCAEAQCGTAPSGCQYKGVAYQPGDVISQGCQKCTCQVDNRWTCSCVVRSVRKEIRDLTRKEITRLQVAIQKLRMSGQGNIWEKMREMYMSHGMHAHGGPYFLPWHRMFLRELEKSLQEIDCEITLPYFDFTTDVGSFDQAIVWQANYFGGNGDGRTNCVTDHNFGPLSGWQPCIMRRFNNNVQLPSLLELALALSSNDYTEMSMCLESYISYLHQYIGGDMATNSAPYDPIFYPIYSYVDMLYWKWQQRGNNKYKYPEGFGNIAMIPFNIPPSSVLDLEGDLCVTYVLQSQGTPCNLTSDPGSDVSRGDIPAAERVGAVIVPGYGRDGFDKMGYNFYGYNKTGFNRDGYDRDGYDVHGYNRYGYDREGYNRLGYNVNGYNRNGEPDTTGQYDRTGYDGLCLNRQGYTITGLDRYGFNQRGYDVNNCNYLNNGPFATIHTLRIWELLSIQDKAFLMSVPRVCPALGTVAPRWIQQFWISDLKDVSTMVPLRDVKFPLSLPTSRFCFDVELYISPCTCETSVSSCTENPCLTETCLSYPEAVCHIDFCSSCTATWYFEGRVVDCNDNRDFCQPNPCLNGGECVASIWPTEPQLVTCRCAPGFDGDRCQHPALEVCSLPKVSGNCGGQLTRWFYNQQTQSCERFLFTGCRGNANNFETEEACESRCEIGACCYRQPIYRKHGIGYNMQGYDRYGFNTDGANSRGVMRNANNSLPWGSNIYNTRGFDWQGYDKDGYNNKGRDRFGYDKEGYDNEGFNILGYNKKGDYDGITEYKETGYSVEGYNRVGMNCHGYNRRGLNYYGTSAGYTYKCRPMRLAQCQKMDERANIEVIQFTPGKRCEDVKCDDSCGCIVGDKSYEFGKTFMLGCQRCTCMITGAVQCECTTTFRRREIRDLTKEELQKFQTAIHILARKTGYPSKWFNIAKMYSSFKPQAVGSDGLLPWNRYFLKHVEQEMQALDCEVTIPYYDFTVDAGDPTRSLVWSANVFGGNGEGDNGCVTSHMFKEYNPPHWSPCLRRRFDTSVNLPDAVYVQYALNEPTYTRFRLRIEHMVNVFKSFVGGHMNSDLSPYDPLYLSFMAYIDKIWDQWQKKYPDGYLRFPSESRFKQMSPFKSTPDNVLSSEIQMCVKYVPITERRICNVTLPLYGYGPDGYDRHGFDRSGYDRDGYDVRGYDRGGNQDNRGIYNALGFDRHGYDRLGYDKNGMDRFGFYVDTYNLDGFDSEGYDRSGYNRYGFDRNGLTPSGFHKNGTWAVRPIPDVFDKYGYNRYGLNKYGFNRKGYDVFGFDSSGLDDEFCNQYFLGPMYMIIKRWTEQELEKLDNRTIRIITRICPAVSVLPPWMYTVNWLRRGDQVALLETIQLQTGKDYQFDPNYIPRTSSVLDNKIWLPLSPDQRLCFVTYYYSECPFGKFPVSCPTDLCKGRACPGVTDALCRTNRCGSCSVEWYNGKTGRPVVCSGYVNGMIVKLVDLWFTQVSMMFYMVNGMMVKLVDLWFVQGGRVECSNTVCPAVTCRYPVQLLGQCCPSCDAGCMYNDRIYENGQSFAPAQCEQCRCSRGDVTCGRVRCPDLGACQSMATPRGECCPVCMDCGEYANATQWSQSPCQRCSCINGVVKCEQIQCPAVTCKNPHTPDGQCCPQCISCSYEGKVVADGESFSPAPCQSCTCSQGTITCDKKQDCPPADCDNPVYPPGGCCPVCDSPCDYDMRTYQHMESFTASYDPCLNCSCVNSIVRCIPIHCPSRNLPCRSPIRRGENCCEYFCPSCTDGGRQYGNGETWTSASDPCKECLCTEGVVTCRSTQNCPVTCSHGVKQTGECCSQCTGCDFRGRMYNFGDTVRLDSCTRCFCRDGQLECKKTDCAPPSCENPEYIDGRCCPVCRGCQYNGRSYREGQRFNPPNRQCETCVCENGRVSCTSAQTTCPRPPCTHPQTIPGECCPSCRDCLYLRRKFRNGQKFIPPGGDTCRVCSCANGNITCAPTKCQPLNCQNPVKPPGYCCGVCPTACTVRGRKYKEGQTFTDPRNRCNICTCKEGEIDCQPMTCQSPRCRNPVKRPNDCCPTCFMCEYRGLILRNRQSFANPTNRCEKCLCEDGTVTCRPNDCPAVNCIDPIRKPGECCDSCPEQVCQEGGRRYREGQTFPSSRDPCLECVCRNGRADCSRRVCPDVTCKHPVYQPGSCCAECSDCTFEGLIFRNGQSFKHPSLKCQECNCVKGNVICGKTSCPPTNCQYPVMNGCCPVCTGCFYQNREYPNGKTFQNLVDPCLVCTCSNGNVVQKARQCPAVSCQHPVQGRCCPECNDCMFERRRYRDGQRFVNPADRCQTCTCGMGTVTCNMMPCPIAKCSNPTQGPCCPECKNCMVDGREVLNGQPVRLLADQCQSCVCRDGSLDCRQKRCPGISCRHPAMKQCCSECTDCFYQGQEHRNGTIFSDPAEKCNDCQCLNGNVNCMRRDCPAVRCNSPATTDCCPVCGNCSYRGQTFPSGASFPDRSDICTTCRCNRGNINCAKKRCPSVRCSHPVQGQCCPKCGGDCLYDNKRIRNGASFSSECQDCTCVGGSVRCTAVRCPATRCSHPANDRCCQVCNDCNYGNRRYRNGQRFPDVNDRCRECQCTDGSVRCSQKTCPDVTCQNPVTVDCCPVCTDCLYRGRTLRNGQSIPGDACQTCTCQCHAETLLLTPVTVLLVTSVVTKAGNMLMEKGFKITRILVRTVSVG
ncbi:hypothetical protein FSP39_013843 [Pinctada imbricata]|uniref:Kielin/chordin-like protein n=1 Tax=Pinctada imbricata TaxID=66713 RepID=A0AA88YAV8_PINIB|nr:hypothetical protein FSP39_013843 [Pinctada imbricata]